ncbi:MAG: hypothetical protein KDC05_06390 [Bacteroidales bacterium]|nr:hypothetical protein [Bacteroidales bacterium]
MDDINELVFRINTKVEKLIQAYNSIRDENEILKNKLQDHSLTISNQKKIIEDLKKERSNLVLAQLVKQAEGKSDVKKRIDEMVREIDRCIGLLNK